MIILTFKIKHMNRFRVISIFIIVLFFLHCVSPAQMVKESPRVDIIPSIPLMICFTKTTNLVFPFSIKSVDRGSRDILVQQVRNIENVLQLKAASKGFAETNLSIITGDGKLYSFLVTYSENPAALNLRFLPDSSTTKEFATQFSGMENESIMQRDAWCILEKPRAVFGVKDKQYGIRMRLAGIFIREQVLYFKLELHNSSSIDYDINILRFFIRDKRLTRRTASQEITCKTIKEFGDTRVIKADSTQTLVFALPKFTIPEKKWLHLELLEKNGGRNLHLKIGNRTIIRAIPVDEPSPAVLYE